MKASRRSLVAAAVPAVLLASLLSGSAGAGGSAVVASGLDNPRGIDIGADGRIAVAEAGAGRIVRIRAGSVTPLVGGLPTATSPEGETTGPVNVALTGRATVFSLIGEGPKPVDSRFASLLRTGRPGKLTVDIAGYQAGDPDPADQDGNAVESNPYGLAAVGNGKVLVTDAANNDLLLVGPRGGVQTVARIPLHMVSMAHLGNPNLVPAEAVPTTVAVGPDGYWYVGELTGFPFTPEASRIWRIAPWARNATCDDDTSDGCALLVP